MKLIDFRVNEGRNTGQGLVTTLIVEWELDDIVALRQRLTELEAAGLPGRRVETEQG